MAIVTRYFDLAGAGAADGTTWADRAPFLNTGVLSTIVTAFDFTSDSLVAVVDPDTYTATAAPTFTGTTTPSRAFPCDIIAGDGAGGLWVPPDQGWNAAQPVWDTSDMPIIGSTSGNFTFFNTTGIGAYGINIVSANTTVRVLNGQMILNWCVIDHNGTSTSANVYDSSAIQWSNIVIRMNGTSYNAALTGAASNHMLNNVRIEGNPSASGGNRHGWTTGANSILRADKLVCIGHVGIGVNQSGAGTGAMVDLCNSVFYGNGSDGVLTNGLNTNGSRLRDSICVGNGGYGLNNTSTINADIGGSRLRNNTSGNTNGPTLGYYTEEGAGSDSDEFVNVSGAVSTWDLRIKNTSSLWGKGYGAGDQPASGGGTRATPFVG